MKDKEDILEYISLYCTSFFNENEKLAQKHYIAQTKLLKYIDKSKRISESYEILSTENPEALDLLKNGYDIFIKNAVNRIYNEHYDELNLNTCSKCDGIARTPKAKQCRYCGYDWH